MKDKNVAGILALFLGAFGIHQFYLGRPVAGVFHLLFSWTGIPAIIGLISAIVYFTMDPEVFDAKYNKGRRRHTDYNRSRRNTDYDRREKRDSYRERRRAHRRAVTERPSRPKRQRTEPRKKPNPFRKAGIEKFKDFEFEAAILDFEKSLEIDAKDIATHFNLACAYSLMENAEASFKHLDEAVNLGFTDFKRIKQHDALAYLRIQDEFDTFEQNGFKLKPVETSPEPEEDLLSTKPNLLDQLKKLGDLRERGLLTEEEFIKQKEKLLG